MSGDQARARRFDRQETIEAPKTLAENQPPCQYCFRYFSNHQSRDNHEKSEHPNGRTPICNWNNSGCDKRISNPKDLSRHIRFEHQHELILTASNSGVSSLWRGPRTAGSVLHRCSLCGDDFLDLNKNTERYSHYCISVLHCSVCDLRFSELRAFNRHLKRHNPDREMFPCTEKDCDKNTQKKPSWTNIFRKFTKERGSSALAAVWASPSVAD